jgi:hypothetical protein
MFHSDCHDLRTRGKYPFRPILCGWTDPTEKEAGTEGLRRVSTQERRVGFVRVAELRLMPFSQPNASVLSISLLYLHPYIAQVTVEVLRVQPVLIAWPLEMCASIVILRRLVDIFALPTDNH